MEKASHNRASLDPRTLQRSRHTLQERSAQAAALSAVARTRLPQLPPTLPIQCSEAQARRSTSSNCQIWDPQLPPPCGLRMFLARAASSAAAYRKCGGRGGGGGGGALHLLFSSSFSRSADEAVAKSGRTPAEHPTEHCQSERCQEVIESETCQNVWNRPQPVGVECCLVDGILSILCTAHGVGVLLNVNIPYHTILTHYEHACCTAKTNRSTKAHTSGGAQYEDVQPFPRHKTAAA